jgi:hypothetical protein
MFNSADHTPSFIGADSLMQLSLGIQPADWNDLIRVYPDPTPDGKITIAVPDENELEMIRIYSMNGQLIQTIKPEQMVSTASIRLPETKGTYLVEIYADQHRVVRKVIRN